MCKTKQWKLKVCFSRDLGGRLGEKASYQVSINLAAKAWFSRLFPSFSHDSHESIGRKLLGNDTYKTYISVAQGVAEEKEWVRGLTRGRLSWDSVQSSGSVLLGDLSEIRVWCPPPPIEKTAKDQIRTDNDRVSAKWWEDNVRKRLVL